MTFTVVRPFYVVGGDGKVCGRDESLPYKSTAKRSTAVSRGPGMPGPYKWAEVYPCGGSGRLAARNERRQPAKLARSCGCLPRRGKHCSLPQFRSAQLWPRVRNPAPRRNSETFLCYFLLVTKESKTSRGTAAPCGFTQILHNIYFAVVVCFVRIHYNRKRYSENKTENGCVTPDDHI